jgi:iron complex transport system ATP-binding protein
MLDPPPMIELNDATVVRDGTPILNQVSMRVGSGEHTAVIGPNGSGKSTLLKLLTGQIYPLNGTGSTPPVRIFGRERWNLLELRRHMGLVSPDLHHRFVGGSSLGHATGIQAVISAFFASEIIFLHHEVTEDMRSKALAALVRLDSAMLADRPMHKMSTGEVRRILIARALVHEPSLRVLDEPTTGLDLVARHDFLQRMRALARDGTTLVLVTHHVEEIVPEIERIILLDGGRIASDGRPEQVLTSDRLSRAFGSALTLRRSGDAYDLRLATEM